VGPESIPVTVSAVTEDNSKIFLPFARKYLFF